MLNGIKEKFNATKKTLGLDEKSQRERMNREIERSKMQAKLLAERARVEEHKTKVALEKEKLSKMRSERFERTAGAFFGKDRIDAIKRGDTFGTSRGFKIGIGHDFGREIHKPKPVEVQKKVIHRVKPKVKYVYIERHRR